MYPSIVKFLCFLWIQFSDDPTVSHYRSDHTTRNCMVKSLGDIPVYILNNITHLKQVICICNLSNLDIVSHKTAHTNFYLEDTW